MTPSPLRGQVHRVALGSLDAKPYVVVSNNKRNRILDSVLAVRVTTTDKAGIPTAVPLGQADPLVGYALADDITEIFKDELDAASAYLGALCPESIMRLNTALAEALGIP